MKISTAALSLAATFVAVSPAFAAKDLRQSYLSERVRLIQRDTKTLPGYAISVYRKGVETYVRTNEIKVVNRAAPRVYRYSKLKLIRAAKTAGKWDELKVAIAAMGMEDEWQACQHIQSDDPAYIAATNAVVTRGIASEAAVKAFMEASAD